MPLDAPEPRRPSLVRQLLMRLQSPRAPVQRRAIEQGPRPRRALPWPPFAVAGLLALAPLLTIGGAAIAERRTRAQIAGLEREAAPKLAATRDAEDARARLRAVLAAPTIGATMNALARGLPSDAALVRAERGAGGRLSVEIAAPDPDRLRGMLRRDPATANLRDAGQRHGEGMMIVTLVDRPR